jgi:energy-coupling factor transporter ATP-binding protein EcfA2
VRIESIDIQNVMRFERFEATFSPSFNVIIGDNGAGKTTLLTLLRRVLNVWTPRPHRALAGADFVRETHHVENGTPYRQPHHPWHLHVLGRGPDGAPFQHTEVEGRSTVGNVRAGRLHRSAELDVGVPLPVLAYFSPWREPPRQQKPRIVPSGAPRRLDGYHDALDLHADFKDFAAWFKGFEMQRVEEGTRVPAVEAVRATVISCIPGCTDIRWVPVLNDIIVTIDGTTHLIWRLSDGFRTMLALVGELAWRAAVLNPAFGADVAQHIEGVVLIDELDLHLHPRWQRRVVADLRRAFPRVQLIATTHSPFIVQSMRAEEVINLDDHAPMEYWREGIEDIASEAMGVEEGVVPRSQLYRELEQVADEYYRLLEAAPQEAAQIAARRARLDELEVYFTDDPTMAAFLKLQRLARDGET